ncbi:MAG TPA: hypothetical protein VG711_10780 [Phycisphaerales bacterium]|nr:hypothetical protein [Phycisphaerales bacterium]
MSTPYRRSSQHGLMWIVIVFIGIGVGIALGSLLQKSVPWWCAALVIMAPILAAIALSVILTIGMSRQRVRGIQFALERQGFLMDTNPGADRRREVFLPVIELQTRLQLANGAEGIQWLALNAKPPVSRCLFEHMRITGSGKSTQVHLHTIIAWAVEDMPGANVSAFRPHALQRGFLSRRGETVTIGDERFDERWLTLGNIADAKTFLTEAMRDALADSPRGESWHVGPGWIACAFDGSLDARNLEAFRRRSEEIVRRSGWAERIRKA